MKDPKRHLLTLRFRSDDLEADFRETYARKSVRPVRYALMLGIFLYSIVFGALDLISAPDNLAAAWTVRGAVTAVALGVLGLTWLPRFRTWMQWIIGALMLAGGLGLVLMLALDPTGENYYDGPLLIILTTFVMMRLRFVFATSVSLLVLASYTVVAAGLKVAPFINPISNVVMMSATVLIGMVAGYLLEDYARREFWQTKVLNEKRKENARLLRSRSRFFANVSHEFRTPLTLILGPLDDWLNDPPSPVPDGLRTDLSRMRKSAGRLLRLINQLLDLARLEVGEWQPQFEPVDLVPFTRDLTRTFQGESERQNIDLTFDATGEARISADPEMLETVITNLVANAIKFTPEDGTVRVAVEPGDDAVSLIVRDTGPGIPEEDVPHVFDRFHQADDSTLRRHDGTGIGLSLAKELVQAHGGAIEVESEVGFGTTFTVTLPTSQPGESAESSRPSDAARVNRPPFHAPSIDVDTETSDATATNGSASSGAKAGAETILIVDDDPDIRSYVARGLSGTYQILEAENGWDGLDRAREAMPDLIITDVMMPDVDGYELCETIKSSDVLDHVPVLMLTARAEPDRAAEGFDAGADAYLAKPFSMRDLQSRIHSLLQNRRRLRKRFRRARLDEAETVEVDSADERFIARARESVLNHLDDEHFNVDAFAADVGLSPRQLQRKLKSITDLTPSAFIRRMRLERGAQLVKQDYGTISEIAYEVGFSSPSYFSRCFKDEFGTSPSEFPE